MGLGGARPGGWGWILVEDHGKDLVNLVPRGRLEGQPRVGHRAKALVGKGPPGQAVNKR